MKNKLASLLFIVSILSLTITAHPGGHGPLTSDELRTWINRETGATIKGVFLLLRDGNVQIEGEDGTVVTIPIKLLAERDQQYAEKRLAQIRELNNRLGRKPQTTPPAFSLGAVAFACFLLGASLYAKKRGLSFQRAALSLLFLCLLLSCYAWRQQAQTNRPAMAAAFAPFSPQVKTHWDEKFLYVESDGIPAHPMMIGIRAWQQQVPLPQPYTGNNAWQIPLKPVLAQQPISAKHALYRGAVALAVNGVPIFNALNNRGEDAYAIGELDEWGGHCGRADDYHYHAAPLHIQQKVGMRQPIAYALDGFPLYGLNEPDGKPVRPLDEFNGHADSVDTYHYHSTKTYPYINGGMRGVVIVRDDQVDPQPRAAPVREFLPPLRGASITDFKTVEKNHWQLKYQLRGKTHEVNYRLSDDGKADFTFIDGEGKSTTEHYIRRDNNERGGRRGGPLRDDERRPPPRRDDQPPNDDRGQPRRDPDDPNKPRRPWLLVHTNELDTNHDGIVTMQELEAEVQATFAAFDRNADGKLTSDEYNNGQGVRRAMGGFVRQHAQEIDTNRDGVITKEELSAVAKRMFSRADRNHDGTLTADELQDEK